MRLGHHAPDGEHVIPVAERRIMRGRGVALERVHRLARRLRWAQHRDAKGPARLGPDGDHAHAGRRAAHAADCSTGSRTRNTVCPGSVLSVRLP